MEARKIIGWNTRRVRVQQGLSIEELADRADLSVATVGRIERGAVNTSTDTMDRLARALRIRLVELAMEPPRGTRPPKPLRAGRRAARGR